ncbi:transcription factor SPEECHLESS-like [Bidens hawaiensis]|uniref:transcription factor SPEECHLESS-like n=1 Tax=Bidens hawaiensis TaxID=980011 RepID=UPI00404B5D72
MGDDNITSLTDVFDTYMEQFALSSDVIFSTLDVLEGVSDEFASIAAPFKSPSHAKEVDDHLPSNTSLKRKRPKLSPVEDGGHVNSDGQQKVAHIAVERNRRKQMNEHLAVLRSLLPCFYVKRSDQASIIEVVVDYITELQQVLQSLEAKKQRKVYSDVLSPRTPQSVSPYRHRLMQQQPSSTLAPSPSSSSSNSDIVNELVANSKSSFADVEVKFSGSNVVLKTVSPRLPGQTTKIVSVLEDLSLEILQAGINTADETMVNSFTIKIGIECQLSAEDLVQHIQETFC